MISLSGMIIIGSITGVIVSLVIVTFVILFVYLFITIVSLGCLISGKVIFKSSV